MKGIHWVVVHLSLITIIYGIAIKDLYSQVTPGLNVGDLVQITDRTTSETNPYSSATYKVNVVGDGWVDLWKWPASTGVEERRFPTVGWASVSADQISQMTIVEEE